MLYLTKQGLWSVDLLSRVKTLTRRGIPLGIDQVQHAAEGSTKALHIGNTTVSNPLNLGRMICDSHPLQLISRPAEPAPAIPQNLIDKPTITIGNETFDIDGGDLESICVLGRGAYGVVEKMKLRQTGTILAVKVT